MTVVIMEGESAFSQIPKEETPWIPSANKEAGQRRGEDEETCSCSFGFWDNAVKLNESQKLQSKLVTDCHTVFSARSTSASENSTGSTFWISRNHQPPKCLLEQLALAILEAHLPPENSPPAQSSPQAKDEVGAEWWTLAIDAEDAAVGFHCDLDYEAEERCHVYRTPHAGTVTYLCDTGAPTLIVEKAPPNPSKPENEGTPFSSRTAPPEDGKPIRQGWLSFPAPGKHIRFPGSFLHGAPDNLGISVQDTEEKDEEENSPRQPTTTVTSSKRKGLRTANKKTISKTTKDRKKRKMRVSLLVNVWLDGAPGYAAPLDSSVAAKLSPCMAKVPFSIPPSATDNDNGNRQALHRSCADPSNKYKKSSHNNATDCRRDKSVAAATVSKDETTKMSSLPRQIAKSKSNSRMEHTWDVANMADESGCRLCLQLPVVSGVKSGATIHVAFEPGQAMLIC